MRKLLLILSACLLSSQVLVADLCYSSCNKRSSLPKPCSTEWPSNFEVDFGCGFRKDYLKWSIAGVNEIPNVLSELQWKDLRIVEVGGSASYVSCRNYAIRLAADYGRIYHGHVVDADYASSDKKDLFLLSNNNAGKGYVYDLSAAAGYRVTSTCFRFVATPLIGYSQHAQYLHLYHGHQLIPSNVRFPGLNSTYSTRWYGPWIGIDFEARVERCAFIFGGFEWHMLAYRGHGQWNLRDDLGPFNHKAYGIGWSGTFGGKWEIWNNGSIGVVGTYRNFRTRHGHETVVYNDPADGPINVRLRFNQANWRTYSVSGIVAWRF